MRKVAIALVVGAAVTVGCGGGGSAKAPPVSLSGTTNNHGTKTASGTIEVELDDYYFEPTFIRATPGQQITVELKNAGKNTHTFTSTDLANVDEQMAPGATKKLSVTVPAAGTALFFCRFHRANGMQGAVVVG